MIRKSSIPRSQKPIRRTRVRQKSKRMNLVKAADALVRERVYERDGHCCVRCGGSSALTPSHVYPKGRYQNLRWLELNILTMCWPCHRYFWHDDPASAVEWFDKTWPERRSILRSLKDAMEKPDLEELLITLREKTQ